MYILTKKPKANQVCWKRIKGYCNSNCGEYSLKHNEWYVCDECYKKLAEIGVKK